MKAAASVVDIKPPAAPAQKPTGLALLREPFPDNLVNVLPKQVKKDDQDKGKCVAGSKYTADGYACGGDHARAVHLSYVGHAALTDRLLDADPSWSWEPVSVDDRGLPALDKEGLLWIKLTVCGVSRLGVGDVRPGKAPGDAMKERIGDALRNAAMRFGAALEFWHKGDLYAHIDHDEEDGDDPRNHQRAGSPSGDAAPPQPPKAEYPADRFETNIESWRSLIHTGRKTAEAVIKQVESGGFALTDEQKATIRGKP